MLTVGLWWLVFLFLSSSVHSTLTTDDTLEGPYGRAWTPTSLRLTTGLYEQDMDKLVADVVETVHFHQPLPEIPTDRIKNATSKLQDLMLQSMFASRRPLTAWNESVHQILDLLKMQRSDEVVMSRVARGVQAFGSFFSWCCDLVTEGQVNPVQKDIKNLAKTMKELVSAQSILEDNIGNTIGQFQNFSVHVHDSLAELEEKHRQMRFYQARMEGDMHTEIHLVLIMIQISTTLLTMFMKETELRNGLVQCSKGYLSPFLIPEEVLSNQISTILRKDSFKGLKYVLNGTNLIYSEKLAHCAIANNSLNIWVKVPLGKVDSVWKITKFIPIPFSWKSSVCTLFQPGTEIIAAVSAGEVFIFEGLEKEHCRQSPICLIPRVNSVFSTEGQCISAIKSKLTVADAVPHCNFHCSPATTPVVIQVATDQFIVSAPTDIKLQVQCNGKIIEHSSIGFGAYRFTIPGNCTLEINNKVAISEREVVPTCTASVHLAEFLVPAFWTTHLGAELDTIQNLNSAPKFSRNTDIVNSSWATHVPTFYQPKPLKIIEIPEVSEGLFPAYHFFPGEDLVLVILLACIIGLLTLLYVVVIILFFKIKYTKSPRLQEIQATPLRTFKAELATQSEMTPLQVPRHRRLALPAPTAGTSM